MPPERLSRLSGKNTTAPFLGKMRRRLIFPGGGDFYRANPSGRRTLTRNGPGATFAIFFI